MTKNLTLFDIDSSTIEDVDAGQCVLENVYRGHWRSIHFNRSTPTISITVGKRVMVCGNRSMKLAMTGSVRPAR